MATGRSSFTSIDVALIGCGEHARSDLLPCIGQIEGVRIDAICDPNEAYLAAASVVARDAACYRDYRVLLEERRSLRAIVVAATPQVHSDVATLAMARGIHVFVEKPPAVSTVELTRMAESAAEAGVVTKVGHNLRHSTAYLELCQVLRPGTANIFDVRYITSGPRGDRWSLNSPVRSFLLSHAIHVVDLVLHALGEPTSVTASATHFENGGLLISARFGFPDGRLSTVVLGDVGTSFQFDAWAMSSEGLIVHIDSLRSVSCKGLSTKGRRWSEVWTPRPLEVGHQLAGFAGELKEFFDAIASGTRSMPSFADEIATYKVIDEIQKQIQ